MNTTEIPTLPALSTAPNLASALVRLRDIGDRRAVAALAREPELYQTLFSGWLGGVCLSGPEILREHVLRAQAGALTTTEAENLHRFATQLKDALSLKTTC
ncbi:MAG: hypothetical protein OQJ98_03215 [Candidatus Pacebacteria bacterium]|nr:hypothetical protein [Candidatus Paceibacterota bacterium]